MLHEIEKLLVLQNRDRKIRALRHELRVAPQEQKDAESKLAAVQQQLDAAKHRGMENEVERKKLQNEAQAKRDSIAKFQTQKFQTRKNEEFQALNNEIKRYGEEIQSLEDKELELMENAEKLKLVIAQTDQQAAATKAQVQRQLTDLSAKTQSMTGQLAELEAERAALTTGVDEDLLDTFDRLFANKTEAVVGLDHEVCTGCHMRVTTQTAVRVKGGREIVHCEHCGRLLYAEH